MAAKMLSGSRKVKTFKYTNIRGDGEEYRLKRPNVFVGTGSEGVLEPGDKILSINNQPTNNISHVDANNLFRKSGTKATLEIVRPGVPPPLSQSDSGMLSSPYSEHEKVHSQPYRTLPLVSPNPKTIHDTGEVDRRYSAPVDCPDLAHPGRDNQDFVPLANQPYRTTPLILPNPKTIHDTGEAEKVYCTSTLDRNKKGKEIPYRTASLVMPGPKTINDVGVGAPMYQPYRGPQYNTQIQNKSYTSQPGQQYNTPRPLYCEESLNSTPAHPGYVQSNKLHLPSSREATISKPHESETFKIVLESELSSAENQQGIVGKSFEKNAAMDRPSSQLSDRSKGSHDAGLKNTSINQSTTFKKVMYSVLGESDY